MRYLPIPDEIASEARATLRDRFDHRLKATTEAAPCRSCLEISREPEKLILLSYQPSPDLGPYAEIGPSSSMPANAAHMPRPNFSSRPRRAPARPARLWA